MNRTLIAVTTAGALALGTLGLNAQGHEGGPERHGGGRGGHGGGPGMRMMMGGGNALDHLTKELDLTPEQQAKVTPIVDQAKPQLQAIHQEARQKAQAVMESTGAQIRPLLTPQQQAKFDALRKAHEDMLNAMKELHEAKSK